MSSILKKIILSIIIIFLFIIKNNAQKIYYIDASKASSEIKSGYFKMGNPGIGNRKLLINSRYLTIGGVPQIPVMGELQYSRMPKERWEDEILKMKACGVNIIATYSFWIHHEEIEGQFDFSGNKDLRSFVKLCKKLGVYVYPRIGPWSHGECRNGGTPDWLLEKKYMQERSLDPVYKTYVDKYFKQLGTQLQGLMYKDGGPVIGIQIENEYWKGKEGEPYIAWLKQTAQKYGMDVPVYTVTGWGNGSIPKNEVIPLWGGYPDESWVSNIDKITDCGNYTFQSFRDDTTIGNAQVTRKDEYNYSSDPYFTCEMGVGIFNSIHRRPVINAIDGLGMIISKIGSGANLLGYYIFAGASNPLGIYTTMEENKDETGYWSELSPVSYDFQAAIKEDGELASSYNEVKKINYFLNEFGDVLAPMDSYFIQTKSNELQLAVRSKNNSGFLFALNYCRNNVKPVQKNVQFNIQLKNQAITFPSKPINIPDSSMFIFPFNFKMNGVMLQYATAQPLAKINSLNENTSIFFQAKHITPEFCFDANTVNEIKTSNGNIKNVNNKIIVENLQPGDNCIINITSKNGRQQKIIVLSGEEAKHTWLLKNENGNKQLYISNAGLYLNNNRLYVTSTEPDIIVKSLKTNSAIINDDKNMQAESEFNVYYFNQPPVNISCNLKQKGALQNAVWLTTSVKNIDNNNLLYHKLFQKEFNVDNPSKIKWAKLIIAPQSAMRFRINDKWCIQKIDSNKINVLDITGYINKGSNILLLDFPYSTGNKSFAARIIVEHFNTDRLDFSSDTSWLQTDSYYFPPSFGEKPVYPITWMQPDIAATGNQLSNETISDFKEYTIFLPCNYLNNLNNLYLSVKYTGDRISVRSNEKLIADNLNNNTAWNMDLKRNGCQLECRDLQLELKPWANISKMYFDIPPAKTDARKAGIQSATFIPEYQIILNLK